MADRDTQLEEALRDRYVIERELGRGGMATVYLARDLRHDRYVALKVLHSGLAAALGPERFEREIKLVARLQHPHILPVFDSGAVGQGAGGGERLWFTMPYVEGESLRERLRRDQQLPLEDAVRITTETARALDYAHRHGVIHRDITPENILLSRDGDALVADFGIGRSLNSSVPDRLTETGVLVGTATYMSPEQAAGERLLDGRTDIYSLGVVLYELLAGEPPYTGPTTQAIIAKRFQGEVPSVRRVRPSVPEPVERVLLKALALVPADRFASAAQLAQALSAAAGESTGTAAPSPRLSSPTSKAGRGKWVGRSAILIGGLVLALILLFAWQRRPRGEASGPRLLAVLPFENQGAPDDEYFADGVTDAVRGKLAALPQLRVTARSSSNQYKKTAKSPQEIGRELGVHYLLTGTVRWDKRGSGGNRVQVNPELVQVATASTQWQQPFDATLSDVFQVQTDIASRVVQALDVALGEGERQAIAAPPTRSLAAYDAYLKGEEASAAASLFVPVKTREAVTHYVRAVTLDPTFALAWAQLSRTHSLLYYNGAPDPNEAAAARTAAERALAAAPERPEGHLALGDYYLTIRRDFRRALEQYALGQRHSPDNAELLTATAWAQQGLGQWDASLANITRAQIIDPRSTATAWRKAQALTYVRRYPEALGAVDHALALFPGSLTLFQQKVMVYLARGDLPGARAVLRAPPEGTTPAALAAFMGTYWDLYWVLDDQLQQLLLQLTPAAFENNRAAWGLALAQTHALRGNSARSRVYADSARQAIATQLEATPNDAQLHLLLGLALAYMGRANDGIREAKRGTALVPLAQDGYTGTYFQHLLARVYLLGGEREKALDEIEPLLKVPYYLSPGWLRVDPTFASLRSSPRFRLLALMD